MIRARTLAVASAFILSALPALAFAEESPPTPAPEPAPEPAPDENTADEEPPETPEQQAAVAAAEMHFTRGVQLVRTEHWEAALAEFDASLAAMPNRSALFNRALCLRHLFRYPEAIAGLERYLGQYAADTDPGQVEAARNLLAAMRELLTEVMVEVNVRGATVSVDDEPVGETPLSRPLQLISGPHEIEVRHPGYLPERRDVVVVADRQLQVDVELRERPSRGVLRVTSNVTGATVRVDGQERGTIPYRGLVDEGEHEIEVTADGYRSTTQLIVMEPNGDAQISVPLERHRRAHRGWFWSTVGLTIAGALTTTGLGIAVAVGNASYDAGAEGAAEEHTQGQNLMLGTDIALGLTLTSAAATLVLTFFTD